MAQAENDEVFSGAVLAGAIPAVSMLIAIFLVLCVNFSKTFQAMMQNFSAGIILAAVMSELYPIIEEQADQVRKDAADANPDDGYVGHFISLSILAGFAAALAMMFGLELFLDEDEGGDDMSGESGQSTAPANKKHSHDHGHGHGANAITLGNKFLDGSGIDAVKTDIDKAREALQQFQIFLAERPQGVQRHECDVQAHILETAIHALRRTLEGQRSRIVGRQRVRLLQHLVELETYLTELNENLETEVAPDKNKIRKLFSKIEELSEHVHVHVERKCHYKPQGPRYFLRPRDSTLRNIHKANTFTGLPLASPREAGEKLSGVPSQVISMSGDAMELKIGNGREKEVATYQSAVGAEERALLKSGPNLGQGGGVSSVPWSFVVAVVVDSLVDGFLVGITFSAHPRSGYIVAGATCVEMFFVGLTYSVELRAAIGRVNCMLITLFLTPPITLMVGSLGGAGLGSAFVAEPYAYIAFISFGIVALVFLVTHELLIAANDNMEGEQGFKVAVWIFLGIYVTWAIDNLVPADAD